MRIPILLAILAIPLIGTAYAETYSDPDYNFTIDYPQGWQGTDKITEYENQKSLLVITDNSDYWTSMFEIILVEDDTLDFTQPEKWILKDMISNAVHACNQMHSEGFECSNFHLISSNAIEINNRNAYQIKHSSNFGSEKYITVFTIVSGNDRYWGLSSMTLQDNYVWITEDIDSMVGSFDFEKPKIIQQESQIVSARQVETPEPIVQVVTEPIIFDEPLVYVNDEFSFSYTLPKGWILNSNEESGSTSQVMFIPNGYDIVKHAIGFSTESIDSNYILNTSDEQIIKEDRDYMNELGSGLDLFNIVKQDFQRYSNSVKLSYELETKTIVDNQPVSKKAMWISWIFDNGNVINIYYISEKEQYSKYLEEFRISLDSFSIKPELGQINSVQSQMSNEQINNLLGTSWDNAEDSLIDLIINTMNPIFDLVFNIQDNERLQQWGMEIIQKQVQTTENQITGQLGYDPRVTCC